MWFLIGNKFKISEASCSLGVNVWNGTEHPGDSEVLEWFYDSEYVSGNIWVYECIKRGKNTNGASYAYACGVVSRCIEKQQL